MFEGEDDDGPDEPITPYAFPSAIKKSMKDDDEEEEEEYRFDNLHRDKHTCIHGFSFTLSHVPSSLLIAKKVLMKLMKLVHQN